MSQPPLSLIAPTLAQTASSLPAPDGALDGRRADGGDETASTVAALMAVMRDLADLLREENALLRRGLPAQAVAGTNRKADLANDYAELMMLARFRHLDAIKATPELRLPLLDVSRELDSLSQENMMRLEAAMQATRRRIESVMNAVRAHDRRGRPYGAQGQATGSALLSRRANYRI